MREYFGRSRHAQGAVTLLALVLSAGSIGCQVDVGGQTLPSPYYMSDDVQYFPPGPEFKLSNEAAALKARQKQEALEAAGPAAEAAVRPGFTAPRWR